MTRLDKILKSKPLAIGMLIYCGGIGIWSCLLGGWSIAFGIVDLLIAAYWLFTLTPGYHKMLDKIVDRSIAKERAKIKRDLAILDHHQPLETCTRSHIFCACGWESGEYLAESGYAVIQYADHLRAMVPALRGWREGK